MEGKIIIRNKSRNITVIEIEGTIGIPGEERREGEENCITTYGELKKRLLGIADAKNHSIIVNIRSTGGDVNDALLIHDALAATECEIITRCYGYVASAATIIAQAASEGKREISRNSLYLIHKSSSSVEGNAEKFTRTIELLDKTDQRIAEIYARNDKNRCGEFIALMSENNGNGRWLSSKEAVEAGLADKIIGGEKVPQNSANEEMLGKLPKIPDQYSNKSYKGMNIKKQWNAIMEAIGVTSQESVMNDTKMEMINGELIKRAEAIADLERKIAEYENPVENSVIEGLQNKIADLEAQNAKLRAKATQTLPKEDPSIAENRKEGNAGAYEKDVVNFKNY